MRHQRSGKKLGRDSAHRRALYSNLAGQLIEHGRIRTTVTKAKAVKPIAEKMITLGRRGDLHARRQASSFLRSKEVVHKLFTELAPRLGDRPGGYARIVKLGPRAGDSAEMAYLELVDEPVVVRQRSTQVEAVAAATPAEVETAEPETVEESDDEAPADVSGDEEAGAAASDSTADQADSAEAESSASASASA